ncbi:MAG: helix-turn-helix transcriptional regulator [Flavobacteriales bacterium]|jgi:predicted DNA-binding transcriptional regulator YafY
MPANKYALLRYRIIDKKIGDKRKPYPNLEDLRQSCEEALFNSNFERVSSSTIEKDLRSMRTEEGLGYYAPIAYSKKYKGYFYEEADYSIDSMPLNDEDIEAIKFAAITLSQFQNIDLFKQFGSAIDKIIGRISISENLEDSEIEHFVQFEDEPKAKGSEYLSEILRAIKDKEELNIGYQSFNGELKKDRIIQPYLLKEFRQRWYVIAIDTKDNRIKTFGLDRIESLIFNDRLFRVNSDFDPDTYFKYSIGITNDNSKPETIQLKFNTQQGNYIKSQPLHKSQTVKERKNGIKVELKLIITPELIMQIQSFGANVEVLKPDHLRETIINNLKKSLENY